jgi:hypothetical protein
MKIMAESVVDGEKGRILTGISGTCAAILSVGIQVLLKLNIYSKGTFMGCFIIDLSVRILLRVDNIIASSPTHLHQW